MKILKKRIINQFKTIFNDLSKLYLNLACRRLGKKKKANCLSEDSVVNLASDPFVQRPLHSQFHRFA